MELLTRKQLAALRSVTPGAVAKANLPQTADHRYDLSNEQVRNWVLKPYLKQAISEMQSSRGSDSMDLEALKIEKMKADIQLKGQQNHKAAMEIAEKKDIIIPANLFSLALGAYAAGVKNYFFQVPRRAGRGDRKLEERIMRETELAAKKTKGDFVRFMEQQHLQVEKLQKDTESKLTKELKGNDRKTKSK